MTYIYDLIFNFDDNLYEFYEWDKTDKYYHIKKVNLLKVDSKTYNDLLDYKVSFNDDILINVFNKCEYYDKKQIKTFPYVFLVTDSYRTMALMLDSELKVIKYSSLLLDEEEEVNEISSRLPSVKLEYNIIAKNEESDLTRNERKILSYIEKDLHNSFIKKDINKLKYLYYEYFNEENDDINYIYETLIKTLNKYSSKHTNLYKLIKLSCNT